MRFLRRSLIVLNIYPVPNIRRANPAYIGRSKVNGVIFPSNSQSHANGPKRSQPRSNLPLSRPGLGVWVSSFNRNRNSQPGANLLIDWDCNALRNFQTYSNAVRDFVLKATTFRSTIDLDGKSRTLYKWSCLVSFENLMLDGAPLGHLPIDLSASNL